jgi:hypothetical protein
LPTFLQYRQTSRVFRRYDTIFPENPKPLYNLYNFTKIYMIINHIQYWRFLATSIKNLERKFMAQCATVPVMDEIATKRVALKPSTWEALSNLRRPGETFDELLVSLITTEQRCRLSHDLDVAAAEPSIPWREAAKNFGL